MLQIETVIGMELTARLTELKSQGALITAVARGKTNSEWIIEFHPSNQKELELVSD